MVLYCASLLRTIFASLARAHERVRVQNVRDYPQTSFDCEINAPFLLTSTVTPTFYFIISMHLCPEMQAVTKMADLTKFRQTHVGQSDDLYANYITRDGVNMLANLAIFMQITLRKSQNVLEYSRLEYVIVTQ